MRCFTFVNILEKFVQNTNAILLPGNPTVDTDLSVWRPPERPFVMLRDWDWPIIAITSFSMTVRDAWIKIVD